MKLLGIAFFSLAVFCVCTVGEDGIATTTVRTTTSTSGTTSVTQSVKASTLQVTPSQAAVPITTASGATIESTTETSTSSLPNATQGITQETTAQVPVKVTTAKTDESFSTINIKQASGTQLPQNKSSDVPSTKASFFNSTISPERDTPTSGTSGFRVSSPTELTTSVRRGSSPGEDKDGTGSDIRYSSVILPIVITLIVITLSVFSLVALYRMCQKKTPETQENGTEQAQSDKDGVKLLSVKTTSPETGEHSSQGKSKTRQLFTSQQ